MDRHGRTHRRRSCGRRSLTPRRSARRACRNRRRQSRRARVAGAPWSGRSVCDRPPQVARNAGREQAWLHPGVRGVHLEVLGRRVVLGDADAHPLAIDVDVDPLLVVHEASTDRRQGTFDRIQDATGSHYGRGAQRTAQDPGRATGDEAVDRRLALDSRSQVAAAMPARSSPEDATLMLAGSTSTLTGGGMRCRAASNSTVSILACGRPGLGDALPAASLAQSPRGGRGCCTGDRPWPARHPRDQALGRACSSAWTPHGGTGRRGRFAWQPIPALIPALCRAGAGFSETSRAPIASIGAGLRAVAGRCETHLGLVDHQQQGRSVLCLKPRVRCVSRWAQGAKRAGREAGAPGRARCIGQADGWRQRWPRRADEDDEAKDMARL